MGRLRSIRRWALRVGVGGLMLLVMLATLGWFWERSEEAAFAALAVTPPDQMLQAGDQMLHVVVSGEGADPGVLLISGLGGGPGDWEAVQNLLSDSMRVVSYDRPGLGWSPPREGELTLDAAVADVEGLLDVPGLFDGPPILVGHSLGGQIARHFAYAHPDRVAGLVILDAPPDGPASGPLKLEGLVHSVFARLAAVGWTRWRDYRKHPDLSRDERLVRAHLNASGAFLGTVRREGLGLDSSPPVAVPPDGLGDMPLTYFLAKWPPPGPLVEAMNELNAEKRLIAQESTRGQLVELDSGHYIQWDHPDIVVAEVLRMRALVDSIRGDVGN